MNCQEARALLEPHLDSALDPVESASLEKHLDSCPSCVEERRQLAATVELIRGIPRPVAPEGFADEILSRLPAGRTLTARLLRFAPLAAAAILLVTTVLLLNRDRQRPRGNGTTEVATQSSPEKLDRAGGKVARPDHTVSLGEQDATGVPGRLQAAVEAEGRPVPDGGSAVARRSAPAPAAPSGGGLPLPGMREPRDPEAPKRPDDSPPPAGTPPADQPAPPAGPRSGGVDRDEGSGSGFARRYVLSGVSPDAAAGQILAELVHLRRGAEKPAAESLRLVPSETESIVADADGEPSRMVLCVTESELDLIAGLVKQRPGAKLERTNGHHPEEEARDKAAERLRRLRVEIRLER